MPLVQHDDMGERLAPHAADHSLARGILKAIVA